MVVAWIRVARGRAHQSGLGPGRGDGGFALGPRRLPTEPVIFHHPAEADASLQLGRVNRSGPSAETPSSFHWIISQPTAQKTTDPASAVAGYWNLVGKSMSSRADQQEQRQVLIDNVRLAAESLKLESTILGAAPAAMVNGQLVREGSVVDGFRVLKIEPRQLIVEREGVKLAVMMD